MHVEKRSLDFLVRRVDQMNDSHVTIRGRGRFRNTKINYYERFKN